MNNHNFLDYLLVMSLRIKSYKLVGRDYISRMMNEAKDDCECQFCTNCQHVQHIKFELFKKVIKLLISMLSGGRLIIIGVM